MKDALKATLTLIGQGGDPLAPEHIETTRAAFPVQLRKLFTVKVTAPGRLVAIGRGESDRTLYCVWASLLEDTCGNGWYRIAPNLSHYWEQPETPSRWERLKDRVFRWLLCE